MLLCTAVLSFRCYIQKNTYEICMNCLSNKKCKRKNGKLKSNKFFRGKHFFMFLASQLIALRRCTVSTSVGPTPRTMFHGPLYTATHNLTL